MPGRKNLDGDERQIPSHFIRKWRKSLPLTIEQVAERSGLSVSTISEVERRTQDFTGRTLQALADALGVTPGDLLARDPKRDSDVLATLFDELEPDDKARMTIQVRALRDARRAR